MRNTNDLHYDANDAEASTAEASGDNAHDGSDTAAAQQRSTSGAHPSEHPGNELTNLETLAEGAMEDARKERRRVQQYLRRHPELRDEAQRQANVRRGLSFRLTHSDGYVSSPTGQDPQAVKKEKRRIQQYLRRHPELREAHEEQRGIYRFKHSRVTASIDINPHGTPLALGSAVSTGAAAGSAAGAAEQAPQWSIQEYNRMVFLQYQAMVDQQRQLQQMQMHLPLLTQQLLPESQPPPPSAAAAAPAPPPQQQQVMLSAPDSLLVRRPSQSPIDLEPLARMIETSGAVSAAAPARPTQHTAAPTVVPSQPQPQRFQAAAPPRPLHSTVLSNFLPQPTPQPPSAAPAAAPAKLAVTPVAALAPLTREHLEMWKDIVMVVERMCSPDSLGAALSHSYNHFCLHLTSSQRDALVGPWRPLLAAARRRNLGPDGLRQILTTVLPGLEIGLVVS